MAPPPTDTVTQQFPALAAQPIEKVAVDTIRTLCMDAVQAANSGHPGTPMALAPVMYTVWQRFLRFDPDHPIWSNRDRFVLSAGHASTLLYAVLHLAGVKSVNPQYEILGELSVPLEDLKKFRQLDSKCPGHPEYRWTAGVECTTGPLGTGIATSVGMAIAGLWQAATFNKPGYTLFDYDVYAICGDGCLMEGISAEAASLAGHLKLSNLCWIYDSNQIVVRRAVLTIEGSTELAFTEDVAKRFEGYGWAVQQVDDANDLEALTEALEAFKAETEKPTMVIVKSVIAWGAPTKQGHHSAHGEPLGAEEIAGAKRFYGWPENESFVVPEAVREHFAEVGGKRGAEARQAWVELFAGYGKEYPELAQQLDNMQRRQLPEGWDVDLPTFPVDAKGIADADEVVGAIIAHKAVRRVNFTGSTRVGRIIAVKSAHALKPCLLELGGKAPLVVLDDADIDGAVNAAVFGSFLYQGQICMSTERFVVDESVADEFVERFAGRAATLAVGDPATDPSCVVGPMVTADNGPRLNDMIDDAVSKGAKVVVGGHADGAAMPATIVDRVTPDMDIYDTETFGPITTVVR